MKNGSGRARLAAALLALALPGFLPADAAETRAVSHTMAAANGFFTGGVFILAQDHRIVATAGILVVQDGAVAGSTGPHDGPWFESTVFEHEKWYLGSRYYSGSLARSDVSLAAAEPSTMRIPIGTLGIATLKLNPSFPRCEKCYATLFTYLGGGYTGPNGSDSYSGNLLLTRWDNTDVEGTLGDLIVTNHVPADAPYGAGAFNDCQVATAASGYTMYSSNVNEEWRPSPAATPTFVPPRALPA